MLEDPPLKVKIRRHMEMPQSIRSVVPLVIGLIIGSAGVGMFLQSMPGAAGSPEQRANTLEVELKKAYNRISALEGADPQHHRRAGRGVKDGLRDIAKDIREGRPVTPDDVFRATQPLLRDLAPLFDRMRLKDQKRMIESKTGELARKYDLTPQQQDSLKNWFEAKSAENSKRWSNLVSQDGTRIEDLVKASRDIRPDEGLDSFMENTLEGDKLASFKTERMAQRAGRVQQEADSKVARLDGIVHLDEAQRNQVFATAARSSRDYDPAMQLDGVSGDAGNAGSSNSQEAILSVLRPEQRAAYDAEQQRLRDEAQKDAASIGLTLPPNWNPLDGSDFH